ARDRARRAEASFLRLHPEVRVGRGGALVAGSVPGAGASPGARRGLHQVHGARRGAPAGLSVRGVRVQPSRALPRAESRPLGLHGEPDPFHARKAGVGAPGPQHDSAQRPVLPARTRAPGGRVSQAGNSRHRRDDASLAAARTVIRYRNGVLNGRGASLLDGYMEDLATDRIYRLMIAQRMRHHAATRILDDSGKLIPHTPALVTSIFDEELDRILRELSS